ncbi:MAG: pentapeptide repeat-containing protein [Cyanobacteria bacterium P01_H01_bin.121]
MLFVTIAMPDFQQRDLRNHCFRHQDLTGANFAGADLRGCDFSYACLADCNFAHTRQGQTSRLILQTLAIAISTTLLAVHANSVMVFGALGITPKSRNWSLVVTLVIGLAIAGAGTGCRFWLKHSSHWQTGTALVSAVASGALLGFFYGGTLSDKNASLAITSAAGGGVLMFALSGLWFLPWLPVRFARLQAGARTWQVLVTLLGTVNAYALALFLGSQGLALILVWQLQGLLLLGIAYLYLGLTLNGWQLLVVEFKEAVQTCFRGANIYSQNAHPEREVA